MDILLIAPSARRRDLLRERLAGAGLSAMAEAALPSDADDVTASVGLADAVPEGREWMQALMPLQGLAVVGAPPQAVDRLRDLALTGWAALPVDVSPSQLRRALEMVDAGYAVAPGDWMRPAPAGVAVRAEGADDLQEAILTDREQDVLDLLAEGLSNQRIAERLGISPHTVKFHVASIYGKLDARTRTQAVRHALDRGLLHI
ncbi:helix-turn-helix transcriptional regulator [Luteitalea sp. TBR-22]|uniref:helix-turn-helix transcriptional regulator n=1 Tax=Luteitalea sp. TBR-22 TaxID=2802971 RepID=UPI001AF13718|nr:response regulator transcription factor [Luteitalea sp. TBR-22]BCS35683.1 helix-turn-helix transcriptional regulator [Luteitalea sp. TBR-22]